MGYYCNICKKNITKTVYFYSIDKFDRALCREHQKLERRTQKRSFRSEREESSMVEQDPDENNTEGNIDSEEISIDGTPKSGWKKVAVKMGKGVKKKVKKVADSSKKRRQIRRWKSDILRRMTMSQLKKLCFEKKISTKKTVFKEDAHSGEVYYEKRNYSIDELLLRLKKKAPLDAIISFANRNHIEIKDILFDRDRKKAEWEKKELPEKISKNVSNPLLDLEKTIREFSPMRQYDKEFIYQDSLASWLKAKFPDTKIEGARGSTRPDIIVNGIAIEVKGPTSNRDLISIADKCLRYKQYYPNGLVCVLFNVNVNQNRYGDWLKGMKLTHPDVVVIKI